MAANFSSIPLLDLALVNDPARKPEFIDKLQYALVNVGFLYLKNHTVPQQAIDDLTGYLPRFFDLSQEAKDKIVMANSPHFLGYSKFGAEYTKGSVDYREQFEFGTPHETQWKPGAPEYLRLWGPSQWPDEHLIPGFRNALETYSDHVKKLGHHFISLLAEAFGLPSDAFSKFYDTEELMQHRVKILKYLANDGSHTGQGVGPHYDSGFLTFLLQASHHPGLQAQNLSGEWIDVPPIPGTFVVNAGKALELVTRGLARAAFHRASTPPFGSTPRYSVPFIYTFTLRTRLADDILDFSPDILALKAQRGESAAKTYIDPAEYSEPWGKVLLTGRVKSFPDVAERHYPHLLKGYLLAGPQK